MFKGEALESLEKPSVVIRNSSKVNKCAQMKAFKKIVNMLGMIEIKGTDLFFTWSNKRQGNKKTWSRLGRVSGNSQIFGLPNEISTKVVGTVSSYRCVVVIQFSKLNQIIDDGGGGLFPTEVWWFQEGDSKEIMRRQWRLASRNIRGLLGAQEDVKF